MIHTRIAAVLTLGTSLSPISAATLYWGGGTADVPDGTTLAPLSGSWQPGTLQNWAADNGPSLDYTTWTNGDSAVFPQAASPYEVDVTGAVTTSGLAVATGATDVTVRGLDATTRNFTLSPGSVVDVPAGSTLRLLSDSAHALSIVTSGFSKTGGGAFEVSGTTVSNSNTAGVIDVQDGILRILGDRVGIFSNESLSLPGSGSIVEVGQGAASVSSITGTQFSGWSGVAGSRIRSSGAGTHFLAWLNNTADGVSQDVLLTDGADQSRLGLVKAGSKTLTVSTANTYTGGTSVVNGRLIAGIPAAVPGPVSVAGSGVFEPAADGAPDAISVEAGGTLIGKKSVRSSSSLTLSPGATLVIPSAGDLPAAPEKLPSWAGRLAFEFPVESGILTSIPAEFPGIIALGSPTAAAFDFSATGDTPLPHARLGAQGTVTYSGLLTPHDSAYRLGGSGTLTLDQTLALTGNSSLDVGYGALLLRANSTATTTVSITGANDLSGDVTVGRSHTLRLEGASGSLASAGSFKLHGGTLSLLDTATGGNGNRLTDTASVVFERGGTLTFLGTRGNTESTGEVRVDSGEATITAAGTGIGASGNALLRFASLGARGATATVTFQNGTNNSLRFQTQPAHVNAIIGGWTITGGANFTDINPSNGQPRQITPAVLASESNFNAVTPSGNYTFDSAVTVTAPASRSVNSLRAHFATGGPFLVDLGPPSTPEAPNTLTIESGGLLLSSNIAGSIAGGALTAGADSGHTLYAFTPATAANSAKTLASPIIDNGASAVKVVKAGAGQLILTSENSYSGGTYINNGNLQIASSANVPVLGSGPLSFDGIGTTLSLGNSISPRAIANAVIVNADSTFSVPSGQGINVTFSGPVSLAADAIWNITGNVTTLSGPISGAGALRFNQGGTHSFTGSEANTFTGPLIITSGTLTLNKSGGAQAVGGDVHVGENDSGFATEVVALGASEQIDDHSIIHLYGLTGGNEGVLRLNGNKTETIGGLRSGAAQGVVENGGAASTSSSLIIAAETNSSFGGLIRNHANGDTTRTLALTKTGPATQRLYGRSEHTGSTTVSAGTLHLDGPLPFSELTVEESGTLSGTGQAGAALTVHGRHRPGAALGGAQTFNGPVTYTATARLEISIGANALTAGNYGTVTAAGAVAVTTGAKLDIKLNPAGGTAEFANAFWQETRSWRVVSAASLTGSFVIGDVSVDADSVAHAAYGSFSLYQDATGLSLLWTPGSGGLTALESWRQTHFGTTANAGPAANLADPDNDGLSNQVEFALHSSPLLSSPPVQTLSLAGENLELHYQRSKAAAQVATIHVQWSDDLTVWSTAGVTETVASETSATQEVVAAIPKGNSSHRFVRIRTTLP